MKTDFYHNRFILYLICGRTVSVSISKMGGLAKLQVSRGESLNYKIRRL